MNALQEKLSDTQIKRGLIIFLAIVLLRNIPSVLFGDLTGRMDLCYLIILLFWFLFGSVGLTYLGFTRWLKIDLISWWGFNRKELIKNLGWGLAALLIALGLAIVAVSLAVWLFTRLTTNLDEWAELADGNQAVAALMAGVVLAVALLTATAVEPAS